jgi:hypothetical protein
MYNSETVQIFYVKFVKSKNLIHIYFNSVLIMGKMAKQKNGLQTVKINFYEKKSSFIFGQKIQLSIDYN